ncbi:MAG: hypothetical protein AAB527_03355 [Patescibacteria group bacterium]
MRYNDFVRRKIQQALNREAAIFQLCMRHGRQYAEALNLSDDDLEVLWRIGGESRELVAVRPIVGPIDQPEINGGEEGFIGEFDDSFLDLEIDGKKFYFIIRLVSEPPHYNGEPYKIIMVFSDDGGLNVCVDSESILLTAILDEWHEKVLERLRSGNIDVMSDDPEKAEP